MSVKRRNRHGADPVALLEVSEKINDRFSTVEESKP
jgi:hypothetical protein